MKRRILMIGGGVLLVLLMAGVAIPGKVRQAGEKAAKIATTDRPKAIEQKTVPSPPVTADSPRPVGQAQLPAATTSASATYEIQWQSINGGGGDIQSANYKIQSSIGQSATGYATSASYQLGAGYWYGVGGVLCSCPHQGDINGDTFINVQDVVLVINRAFKGAAAVKDPLCPKERANFNADAATNVQDVVGEINRAFKGGPKPVNPCL